MNPKNCEHTNFKKCSVYKSFVKLFRKCGLCTTRKCFARFAKCVDCKTYAHVKCVKQRQDLLAEKTNKNENTPLCETETSSSHNDVKIEKSNDFNNGHEKQLKNHQGAEMTHINYECGDQKITQDKDNTQYMTPNNDMVNDELIMARFSSTFSNIENQENEIDSVEFLKFLDDSIDYIHQSFSFGLLLNVINGGNGYIDADFNSFYQDYNEIEIFTSRIRNSIEKNVKIMGLQKVVEYLRHQITNVNDMTDWYVEKVAELSGFSALWLHDLPRAVEIFVRYGQDLTREQLDLLTNENEFLLEERATLDDVQLKIEEFEDLIKKAECFDDQLTWNMVEVIDLRGLKEDIITFADNCISSLSSCMQSL